MKLSGSDAQRRRRSTPVTVYLSVLCLALSIGCRESKPPVAKSDGLTVTPTDVADFQDSIWSKQRMLDSVFGSHAGDEIKALVAEVRSQAVTKEHVREYLEHVYSGNLLRCNRAIGVFSELPAKLRAAVEPAIFSFAAHNGVAERRRAIHQLATAGSPAIREPVDALYLSPSPVITAIIGDARTERSATTAPTTSAATLLETVAPLQWRPSTPTQPWQSNWEAQDDALLPEEERTAKLQEMQKVVDAFFETPNDELRVQLIGFLYSRDWKVRSAALKALRDAPPAAYTQIAACVPGFLTDPHPTPRIAAIELLCIQAPEESEQLRAMLRLSPYEEIAAAAACEPSR